MAPTSRSSATRHLEVCPRTVRAVCSPSESSPAEPFTLSDCTHVRSRTRRLAVSLCRLAGRLDRAPEKLHRDVERASEVVLRWIDLHERSDGSGDRDTDEHYYDDVIDRPAEDVGNCRRFGLSRLRDRCALHARYTPRCGQDACDRRVAGRLTAGAISGDIEERAGRPR